MRTDGGGSEGVNIRGRFFKKYVRGVSHFEKYEKEPEILIHS